MAIIAKRIPRGINPRVAKGADGLKEVYDRHFLGIDQSASAILPAKENLTIPLQLHCFGSGMQPISIPFAPLHRERKACGSRMRKAARGPDS